MILWFVLVAVSVLGGILLDLALSTAAFPLIVRLLGLMGMVAAHFPLKRAGKLLRLRGEPEQWACTSRLVTSDIYRCARHPHHLGVGVFMTSLGLLIGHRWSFMLIAGTQWLWILGFLFLVEEKKTREKFGDAFEAYWEEVPTLLPKLRCATGVLIQSMDAPREEPEGRVAG